MEEGGYVVTFLLLQETSDLAQCVQLLSQLQNRFTSHNPTSAEHNHVTQYLGILRGSLSEGVDDLC